MRSRAALTGLVVTTAAHVARDPRVLSRRQAVSTNGACGPQNGGTACPPEECCSADGFCGTGQVFCGTGCQRGFTGKSCDGVVAPRQASTAGIERPVLGGVPYGSVITECTELGKVALTFDDGPSAFTSDLLDTLAANGARATFFINGNNGGENPIAEDADLSAIIQRMHTEGHQIGSHSWSHADLNEATAEELESEIIQNEDAFNTLLGFVPTYFRPPFGNCDETCLADMTRFGYHVTNWGIDTFDWDVGAVVGADNFDAGLVGSSPLTESFISLSHDIYETTVSSLAPHMIQVAQDAGFELVTIGECLGDDQSNWYRNPTTGASWSADATTAATINIRQSRRSMEGSASGMDSPDRGMDSPDRAMEDPAPGMDGPDGAMESPAPGIVSPGLVSPEAMKDAPAPEAMKDAPAPEAMKDAPAPEAMKDAPAPEAMKDAPAPEAMKDAPAPEAMKDAPAPDSGKDTPAPGEEAPPAGEAPPPADCGPDVEGKLPEGCAPAPEGEAPRPDGEAPPAGDAPRPDGEAPLPEGEAPRPDDCGPDAEGKVPEGCPPPAGDAPAPACNAPPPAGEAPRPDDCGPNDEGEVPAGCPPAGEAPPPAGDAPAPAGCPPPPPADCAPLEDGSLPERCPPADCVPPTGADPILPGFQAPNGTEADEPAAPFLGATGVISPEAQAAETGLVTVSGGVKVAGSVFLGLAAVVLAL